MLRMMIRKMRGVMFKGSLRGQHPWANLIDRLGGVPGAPPLPRRKTPPQPRPTPPRCAAYVNLTRKIALSEERALQIGRCTGLLRAAEVNNLRRKRMPASLALEARLQGHADTCEACELAVGVVKVGGRVGGKDIGQKGEVVRVYGYAEGVQGVLDFHDGNTLGEV